MLHGKALGTILSFVKHKQTVYIVCTFPLSELHVSMLKHIMMEK